MNRISSTGTGRILTETGGLFSVVVRTAESQPDMTCLTGESIALTASEVVARAERLGSALIHLGVEPGDRIAVLGRTGVDWVVIDLAVLAIGAIVVPVYPTSSATQIEHILSDAGPVAAFGETVEDRDRLRSAGARRVWTFAESAAWAPARHPELPVRTDSIQPSDVAMIVYTSGTTGSPKGCTISHGNMYASAANTVLQAEAVFTGAGAQASTVIGLPLAHVFGQTILFCCLIGRSETRLAPGIPALIELLPQARPTFLALVPYALEKIRKARPGGDDLAALLGGRLRHVISGGASLDESTVHYFAAADVAVLNCYGMTEAATAVTVSAPSTNRIGTVGRPIPGTEVATTDDGEVLVRGANVTGGYWGVPGPVVDDEGWFHTGDVGVLDGDGYLRITGRSKEILITSGGKNVAPTVLEDRIRLHPLVADCMVVGEGRAFVAALITIDPAAYASWSAGLPVDGVGDAGVILRKQLQGAVDDANRLVSRAESIRTFRVVDGDFTVENGLLTASLKLRRAAITEAFGADIDAMYGVRA
ncbi:AMP-dependent synthetase/ligase [Tsukamurella sp. 8F]|uniref:AMP-dependent synthetase/ligase n=1 Tax=unclassified Tsukamurella TaxID=2633480 RepID=UPI0023B8C0CA|nr:MULTISPECIES: AMP-dependent synthetase/ligase [unclassified Tsukamurella]MDF0529511.1 AMP-dependent synthetase/ligase [Tsukamurella sp. 8J]MDF0585801.1 AMP-dependent synthetase/ligase [Tsukamurella sp. 8F]